MAAEILIWLTISESLYNPLKKIAISDSEVTKSLETIEKALSKEIEILNQSGKNDLINEKEKDQVEAIRKARNIYANPMSETPTKKESLCSLNSAVSLVLSREPLIRYYYVNNFILSIIRDPHYFEDDEFLVGEYIDNLIKNCIKMFIIMLLKN